MGSSGPTLGPSFLYFSFSGTSPESLLVGWPPLGSSGWLCPPPSSLCLLLRVIRKKSDSGASPELRSGPSVFSLSRVTERGEYRLGCSGPALGLSFLYFSYSACSGAPSPGLPLSLSLSSGLLWAPLATLCILQCCLGRTFGTRLSIRIEHHTQPSSKECFCQVAALRF